MTDDVPPASASPRSFTVEETRALLPFDALVEALARAFREQAAGRIACPLRQVVALPGGGKLLSMAAVAADIAVHKLVSVVPDNRRRGLPTIQGRLTVMDPATGCATMTLDAATVTGRRTAAVTMLGIVALCRDAPREILLLGTGVQASHHVEAIAATFPQASIFVLGRDIASSRRFADRHPGHAARLVPVDRPEDAPRADVVVTCTSSRVPVYREPASVGRLVVAVGSYEPDVAEIGAETVRASRVVVDDPAGASHEAGDLIMAGVEPARIEALADLLDAPPRRTVPLLLKTVGCAAWDLAAARVATGSIELAARSRPCENPAP